MSIEIYAALDRIWIDIRIEPNMSRGKIGFCSGIQGGKESANLFGEYQQ